MGSGIFYAGDTLTAFVQSFLVASSAILLFTFGLVMRMNVGNLTGGFW
nr:hypothetical protein [uncultured bacterium]